MESFFVDDSVALKEDPSIRGVIEQTWRDVDSSSIQFNAGELIRHKGLTKPARLQYLKTGTLPQNYVIVKFIDPYDGQTILKEDSLILVDRGLIVGDVVKRGPAHVESGTVIHTSIGCTLEPIYARAGQGDSWPAETHGSFLAQIPGAELKLAEDFVVGDYVIYRDNIGQINDIYEIVSIRLNNGSIVKVKDPDELEIAQHMSENPRQIFPTLAASLKANLKGAIKATGRGDTFAGDPLHLGQTVFTKKANLRLGEWVYGAYDPSVPPRGVVVDVQTTRLYIDWITSNIFERQRSVTTPPTMLLSDEFPELIIFNKGPSSGTPHTATAHLGSRHNGEFSAGEHVRFRDIAGAAVKYAEPSRHGQFHRIPRTATSGYDMNVFLVKETKLTVTVQWQDATTSIHEAKSLIPYLNVDDHDVWVGEIVGDKTAAQSRPQQDAGNESVIYPKRVGVVQSANARERVATVRWFVEPAVGIFDEQRSVLLPGSTLGQLGNEETQVSLYEIVAYPALTRRRGDLVLIAPSAQLLALHSAQALLTASTGSHPPPTMPSLVNTDPEAWLEELRNLPQNDSGPTWFGEIIDLGTDGLLTVRLGALQEVYDVRVPVETLITVVGGDDAGLHSDQDSRDDYYSDDISMSSYHHESDNVIEETVEYEGGQRIDDDGGDEVWTTDDDDPSKESPSSSNEGSNESESEADDGDARSAMELPEDDQMLPYKPSESPSIVTAPNLEHGSESTAIEKSGDLLFSTYRDMPEQFEILDEDAPADHHFLAKAVGITGGLLRRIRQEHGILKHSLPDGVWVRTWAERLDLLRVLIIGAHDTPYEMAPFVLDFQFHQNFPRQPPSSFFHSWDQGVGRINPNMYEDGKVCLSLLGTWDSDNKGEGWSKASSMLQIIVSLLGLVLVREPYYNEAGFEQLIGTEESRVSSDQYSEKARVMSKGFVLHALTSNIASLDNILTWLYLVRHGPNLLKRVLASSNALLGIGPAPGKAGQAAEGSEGLEGSGSARANVAPEARVSAGAMILLRRHVVLLQTVSDETSRALYGVQPEHAAGSGSSGL